MGGHLLSVNEIRKNNPGRTMDLITKTGLKKKSSKLIRQYNSTQ